VRLFKMARTMAQLRGEMRQERAQSCCHLAASVTRTNLYTRTNAAQEMPQQNASVIPASGPGDHQRSQLPRPWPHQVSQALRHPVPLLARSSRTPALDARRTFFLIFPRM
jgi:hypothetical protein